MLRRDVLKGFGASAALGAAGRRAYGEDVIKIGMCLSMTGGFQILVEALEGQRVGRHVDALSVFKGYLLQVNCG